MLLEAIRLDGSPRAWEELDGRCRPIMVGVARRMGLSEALAEEAAQGSMIKLYGVIQSGRFDRRRGSLRALCRATVRSEVIDLWRKRARDGRAGSIEELDVPCERELERFWLDERRDQILRRALDELRDSGTDERTIQAFELFGLRRLDPSEVGASLGMSREEVYMAKFRVAKRLRPIVARLDEMYEDL